MDGTRGPAYRIETQRTRLRCFCPADVELLERAVTESLDHLRPWMSWTVHEPLPRTQRVDWLRTQRGHFDLDSDYNYGIFSKDERALLGAATLRINAEVDERELGYWVHAQHVGQGLATEVVSALLRVGFEVLGLALVELKMVPHNERSARIAHKLGFHGPVLDPLSYPMPDEGKVDLHVYSLSRIDYAGSPARAAQIEAYDVLEQRIL